MADIDAIIQALLSGNSDYELKNDSMYGAGQQMLAQQQDYSQMNPWAAAAFGLGKGLIGGGMESYGKSQATERAAEGQKMLLEALGSGDFDAITEKYPRLAQVKGMMDVAKVLDERKVYNDSLVNAAKEGLIQLDTGKLPEGFTGSSAGRDAAGFSSGDPLVDEELKLAQGIRTSMPGISPERAAILGAQAVAPKRKKLTDTLANITASRTEGEKISALEQQAAEALGRAGYTGFGGNIMQSLSGAAGLFDPEQQAKYSAGQDITNAANEAVKVFGRAFKGPMSDNDVKIMLRAAPSLTNTKDANESILRKWRYASEVQKRYSDFMTESVQSGKDVLTAEREWGAIKDAQPYAIQDPNTGELVPNPFWEKVVGSMSGTIEQPGDDPRLAVLESLRAELAQLQAARGR